MAKYEDIYQKSAGFHEVKRREYKKVPREKSWKKRIETAAVCGLIAVSVYAGNDIYQNQQMKNNLMLETTNQMMEVGYKTVPDYNGKWDQNYYLLKDLDMLGLYSLMGQDELENVLRSWGYDGWQGYLAANGYKSIEEWRQQSVNNQKEETRQR